VSSSPTKPGDGGGAGSATLIDVTMPQMGVSVAEGTIVVWRFEVGDRVQADETICEISTDKIDTEVPSPASGVVAEILVPVETTVEVGTPLARIAISPGSEAATADADSDNGAGTAEAGVVAPEPGVAPGPPPAAEDDRAGESVERNGASRSARAGSGSRRYSPVVQRMAAEHDVDLDQVPGTGRDGRVRKQDVLAFIDSQQDEPPLHIESPYRPDPTPPAGTAAPAAAAAGAGAGAGAGVPAGAPSAAGPGQLSRMRRQIGEHMKRSLEVSATCTTWIEADLARVETARRQLGVTALAYVARASIETLREFPALNAWMEGERYTQHSDVNLGIAVSLGDDGLIVPVIHRAHELSVEGLAARIRDLARRARSRQLTPDEVRAGTFTITNPGQYGSIMATPIINQPQVAILDFEAVIKRPVVVTDQDGSDSIAIRPMTILGLSWDHRALDGAVAAQFLAGVKRRLEDITP
jgi:pyruvate/2-oxoglutarate dehydrogenase complex dihydrolipoamide acyltransferase (E2) component